KGVCKRACEGADVVFHLAAYISVPGSVADPDLTHSVNVEGFFNLLQAARECGAGRFVYASSSAVYGDDPILPKVEDRRGRLLSPYAVTKLIDELYAESWGTVYGMDCVGLRYFNVFGPRQDPNGPYAAVIPRWAHALRHGEPVTIFGDGQTSRDFCYVKDVVRANLLAATTKRREAVGGVCNIACGVKTTLNELFAALKRQFPSENALPPVHEDFRRGDIAHSLASIERARALLGYSPLYSLEEGLREMLGESSNTPST
ncbi:MAG: NAD-dependent epimerase/dehydratase family protein, partial [Synergistaceae bacterium]|nr:NAD-dependent epimerase/dehydratase family protein [Synergistaceae bacterium]